MVLFYENTKRVFGGEMTKQQIYTEKELRKHLGVDKQQTAKEEELFFKHSFCYVCHMKINGCKCKISSQVLQPHQFRLALSEQQKQHEAKIKEIFRRIELNYTTIKTSHGNYKTISKAKIDIIKNGVWQDCEGP